MFDHQGCLRYLDHDPQLGTRQDNRVLPDPSDPSAPFQQAVGLEVTSSYLRPWGPRCGPRVPRAVFITA